MSKYVIWDKVSEVITPIGEVLTAAQWKQRYPMAKLDRVDIIVGGGVINGAYCMEYTQTKANYEKMGCDFSDCETKQEVLDKMEAFEEERNNAAAEVDDTPTAADRIASILEMQYILGMDDGLLDEEEETE